MKFISKSVNTLATILVMLLILGILYGACKDKEHKIAIEAEYNGYMESYTELDNSLVELQDTVKVLNEKEIEYEDGLYNSIKDLYNEWYDDKDMKHFIRLYDEVYPSDEEYTGDRKGSFIRIYAMVNLYEEEFNNDVYTKYYLGMIKDNTSKLFDTINEYNITVDKYVELIEKLNNCEYVIITDNGSLRVDKDKYQKIIVEE